MSHSVCLGLLRQAIFLHFTGNQCDGGIQAIHVIAVFWFRGHGPDKFLRFKILEFRQDLHGMTFGGKEYFISHHNDNVKSGQFICPQICWRTTLRNFPPFRWGPQGIICLTILHPAHYPAASKQPLNQGDPAAKGERLKNSSRCRQDFGLWEISGLSVYENRHTRTGLLGRRRLCWK